jgi:hypothetical protein
MITRLDKAHHSGTIVNLYYLFAAFALDVVSEYTLGQAGSTDLMTKPEFGKSWSVMTTEQVKINPFARQFPILMRIMMFMPEWLMIKLMPEFKSFVKWQNGLVDLTRQVINQVESDTTTPNTKPTSNSHPESLVKSDKHYSITNNVTVLHSLARSPDLPPKEKSLFRLRDELNMLLGAGGETTAQTLTRTSYYILDSPDVQSRLLRELKDAIPDPNAMPALSTLQGLPYLTAVIEEGVRIALPVLARSPRVFRDQTLTFGKWTIKPGVSTVVPCFHSYSTFGVYPG